MTAGPLTGVGVLVTRPAHQSGELGDAIESAGGHPILFPVIDIVPRDNQQIKADLAHKIRHAPIEMPGTEEAHPFLRREK